MRSRPGRDPLADHGDRQVPPGAVDLAVNVWRAPPAWLRAELRRVDVSRYPDARAAEAAAAERHGRDAEEILAVNGAAEAFWALACALRPRLAVCVHPSFTAPEAALRGAGVPVHRVVRRPGDGFALDPAAVPDEADLVVLGRPDNPTGRVEEVDVVAALCRPGRTVVVDEAFAEFHADADGLARRVDLPGLVCVRSLTKLWALPGLRVGYLVAEAAVVARARGALQPWPVNALAARAIELLSPAEAERSARAGEAAAARESLVADLCRVPGLRVWPATANYLLLRAAGVHMRDRLLDRGLAVRRADTFPGLDTQFARVAVHPRLAVRARVATALGEVLART
jgi:histidinol-phosphate/aromatic aminotransferase/cobyric acid decarboxylase-like protein